MPRRHAILLLPTVAVLLHASFSDVQKLYESVQTAQDNELAMLPKRLATLEDEVKGLPRDEVKPLLTLVNGCLESSRSTIRSAGLMLLFPILQRADSSALLEPYLLKIAAFLNVSEPGQRRTAVYILASTQPIPSRVALGLLDTHLDDRGNSSEELRITAAAILANRPSPTAIHHVLMAASRRQEPPLMSEIIQLLGQYRITDDEAVEFIRSGVVGPDLPTRMSAINAVERLPKEARARFAADLQRVANDVTGSEEIRSRASKVLTGQ